MRYLLALLVLCATVAQAQVQPPAGGLPSNPTFSGTVGAAKYQIGGSDVLTNPGTAGTFNYGIGGAGSALTSGVDNIALGHLALATATDCLAGGAGTGFDTAIGFQSLQNDNGCENTGVGSNTLNRNTTGIFNVCLGNDCGGNITTGSDNIGVGHSACDGGGSGTALTGNGNTCIGDNSGSYLSGAAADNLYAGQNSGTGSTGTNNTGSNNIGLGWEALFDNSSGANNVAVGFASMQLNTTSSDNTAIGRQALQNNTTGANNVAAGSGSMQGTGATPLTGNGNTAVGYQSLLLAQGSATHDNTTVGYQSLNHATGANEATVVGGSAATGCTTCFFVAVFGQGAGTGITTGNNMTIIGQSVAPTCANGNGNIMIGTSNATDCASASANGEVNIGGLVFYNKVSLAAPAVTACGTTPTIDSHANNKSGTVTEGSGTVTSCTITFAGSGYTTWNHCRVTSQLSEAAFAYSYTLTAITITATSLTSDKTDYDCDGY